MGDFKITIYNSRNEIVHTGIVRNSTEKGQIKMKNTKFFNKPANMEELKKQEKIEIVEAMIKNSKVMYNMYTRDGDKAAANEELVKILTMKDVLRIFTNDIWAEKAKEAFLK